MKKKIGPRIAAPSLTAERKKIGPLIDGPSLAVGVVVGIAAKAVWTAFSALPAEKQTEVLKAVVDALAKPASPAFATFDARCPLLGDHEHVIDATTGRALKYSCGRTAVPPAVNLKVER